MRKGYKALLAEAEAEIETVPVEQALTLQGDAGTVFVDLRDPREIQREGRIPGSFSCPRGMLEFWIDPESPYAKPIFQVRPLSSTTWPAAICGCGLASSSTP